jgi:hypothetical protein
MQYGGTDSCVALHCIASELRGAAWCMYGRRCWRWRALLSSTKLVTQHQFERHLGAQEECGLRSTQA